MDIKTVSDNKTFIVTYTNWYRNGFKYEQSINWKHSEQNGSLFSEGEKLCTIAFFLYLFSSRSKLDHMLNKNVNKIVDSLKK